MTQTPTHDAVPDDVRALEPCPFCDDEAAICGDDQNGFMIACQNCSCTVGEHYKSDGRAAHIYRNEREAMNDWNTRATRPSPIMADAPADPDGAVEALKIMDQALVAAFRAGLNDQDFDIGETMKAVKSALRASPQKEPKA